ncbi:hypothetical protein TRVL_08789 [Trypanosoma vivax]|nr:hypothetical protein TRVL_08789 [Trypanosoma vivax]
MKLQFAAADGESTDLKQRICQLEGQIHRMLECAQSIQDANGVVAAENGLSKVGGVQTAAETRGASAQRSEPNAQSPQQWAGTVFDAPATGERQQLHNAPLATNVGFRGIQMFRDKFRETPFKSEEKIRARASIWWQSRPNTYFQRAAACF